MNRTSPTKKWLYSGAIALGVAVGAAGIASATVSNGTPTSSNGTVAGSATNTAQPHSNEDPTHEKAESRRREADENSGKLGGQPGFDRGRNHGSAKPPILFRPASRKPDAGLNKRAFGVQTRAAVSIP